MRGLLIKNTEEIISLAAYNVYGATFKLNVFNQGTNTYIVSDQGMDEGMEPVGDVTTTTTEDRIIGQETIPFDSIDGLSVSDRLSIGAYIYRVVEFDGVNVKLHKPLYEDIASGTSVTLVGNMGVYSTGLTVGEIGTFLLQVKDSAFGIQHTDSIKVQEKSIRELLSDVNTDVDEIQTTISNKQGYTMMI